MGKAGRWLRSFLGAGKQPVEEEAPEKDKKRWPLCRSARVPEKPPEKKVVVEMRPVAEKVVAERLRSRREFDRIRKCDDDCTNRNKHAVAVAAATAAVAEAAVAAAKAAAAVVQLTRGGSNLTLIAGSGGNGDSAATRIQAAFRGYLARRALRALKALVKVQALVRGYIVRKQAARTLRCMQALVRVQARARQNRFHRFDGTPLSLSHRQRYKNASKLGEPAPVYDRGAPRSWLDRWVDINHERSQNSFDDETPKVLEVDPGKPLFVTRHKSKSINSRSLSFIPTTAYSDPVKGSTIPLFPSPSSSVDMPLQLCVFPEEDEFESSPLSLSTSSQKLGRFEYAQSELGGCRDYPNYMSNTESWRGKARSRSAPRSRAAEFEKCGSAQRVQADGLTDARSSVSPVLSQRSSSLRAKFTSKAYPGSGRLDRLGMPVRARG